MLLYLSCSFFSYLFWGLFSRNENVVLAKMWTRNACLIDLLVWRRHRYTIGLLNARCPLTLNQSTSSSSPIVRASWLLLVELGGKHLLRGRRWSLGRPEGTILSSPVGGIWATFVGRVGVPALPPFRFSNTLECSSFRLLQSTFLTSSLPGGAVWLDGVSNDWGKCKHADPD